MSEEVAEDEKPSKGQMIAYNVGVVLNVVDRVSKTTAKLAYSLEKVKNLFKPFNKQAQASNQSVANSFSSIIGSPGGSTGIMGMLSSFNIVGQAMQHAQTLFSSPMLEAASAAEQAKNTMAGTFTALGFTSDIQGGLSLASTTLERIRRDSAALPGEAQDYITVFRAGMPALARGFDNNMDSMLQFSNQFAANASAMGVDAAQAGRDMNLMLRAGQGGAGADVSTFQTFLPFINSARQARHQTDLTAESFNRMTQTQRITAMQNAFHSLQPMLDLAANTFDAQKGAMMSTLNTIQMAATEPFFDMAKDSLRQINRFLDANVEKFKVIGRTIAGGMVAGLQSAVGWVERLGSRIAATPEFAAAGGLADRALSIGRGIIGNENQSNGAIAGVSMALMGPVGILVAVFKQLAERTQFINDMMSTMNTAIQWLMLSIQPLLSMLGVFTSMIADVAQGALVGLMEGIGLIAQGLAIFFNVLSPIVTQIYNYISPALHTLGDAIGTLFRGIGQVILPILRIIALGLAWVWDKIGTTVMPIISGVIRGFSAIIEGIGWLLRKLGSFIGSGADSIQRSLTANGAANNNPFLSMSSGLESAMGLLTSSTNANTAAQRTNTPRTPSARGGSKTTNDFRNSRFDITQKFSEGFDPDRVAVAFASDLESMTDQRLQSNYGASSIATQR